MRIVAIGALMGTLQFAIVELTSFLAFGVGLSLYLMFGIGMVQAY